jgi:hypothetical protein
MELSYMVRGADGKQYGPASLELLGSWIREGRLPAQQSVKRSDMEQWALAGDFTELQPIFESAANVAAPTAPQAATARKGPATMAQLRPGASWFYWIAGLSLINSIAAASGSTWRFMVGLGITQVFDELAGQMGGSGKAVALVLDLMVTGVFVVFGILANKAQTWAFVVGMVLFALDGFIFLVTQQWLGVAFHVLVLFFLFRGLQACRQLKQG